VNVDGRYSFSILLVLALSLIATSRAQQTPRPPPPYWAFAVNPINSPSVNPEAPDAAALHVPGSNQSFTRAQVTDLFNPPDWHPAGHPNMPEVVVRGRRPKVYACGYCHLPNGQGRPENSRLAGLPAGYIVRQIADFKSGARQSSEAKLNPVTSMIAVASQVTDQDVQAAAKYFAGLKPQPWIRVVETKTVPKTKVSGWMLIPSSPAASEPIGRRIIETPENVERTELGDDASGFIAYVPEGSLKRGKVLVTTGGGGKTIPCAKCHGQGLRGNGNVPSIAGRSPSYMVRQLYDIQAGARAGVLSQQMRAPAAKLTLDDLVDIAAYTAWLRP
jgi:cytochrome c553